MSPFRHLVIAAVLVASLGACDGEPATPVSPTPDPVAAAVADLRSQVDEVAEGQQAAHKDLATVLAVVSSIDRVVVGLRDPVTVDGADDDWDRVEDQWAGADLPAVRPALLQLAADVDEARASLTTARAKLDTPWEQRYLAAQDAVLVALRDYAAEADALAQVLEQHWRAYERLHDITAEFVEQRWFYRSAQEAADAYQVKTDRVFGALSEAQQVIARFVERRDAAGRSVNAVTANAATVWRERPRVTA